jgi:peptidoglycan hydrolase CwlO-like protein
MRRLIRLLSLSSIFIFTFAILISTVGATDQSSATSEQMNQQTANAVNRIPNVNVTAADLTPPEDQVIKGFHPIERLLQPIKQLQAQSLKLEQQIMRLEGPIAGLQPPMLGLQKKMTGVESQVGMMQNRLDSVEDQVIGVRSDIANMRKDIHGILGPMQALERPISNVATPLLGIQGQLAWILVAIMVASVAIAFGTPVAAILIYINRHKLFPGKSTELPDVTVTPKSTGPWKKAS